MLWWIGGLGFVGVDVRGFEVHLTSLELIGVDLGGFN